ncbi:PPOX class F420-dependent oxidoreductase [Thermoactinospora rubra]|uniref:PPOX class F420-dependent oxidoreductase n=1 Tax=Thermoactinospora rubra TaxID=1088767 RepID=UPI000A0F417B|nr:PPOX class F420-dependent oxidoreductase [Thermoactinospora rubra]
MTFTEAELAFLRTQRIGRLATVSPGGQVQNNPVGFFLNPELGTVDIGGHNLGATKKFRNIQAGSTVSLVVDELVSTDPWVVRGIEIRGTAQALTGVEPPVPFFSGELIRIRPVRIVSWGLDGPTASRTVAA